MSSAAIVGMAALGDSPLALAMQIQFPLVLGSAGLYLARIKCPNGNTRLSKHLAIGALAMLPFAKQPCKVCRHLL